MLKSNIKMFVVLAILGTIAMNTTGQAAGYKYTFTACLEVDGVSQNFNVQCDGYTEDKEKGTITLDPKWRIDNVYGGQYSTTVSKTFKRGNYGTTTNGKIAVIITSNNDEFDVDFLEPLKVSIFDLNGKCIYSATDITNVKISGNTLNIINGHYMLHLENKEGEIKNMNFIFINSSIFINNHDD